MQPKVGWDTQPKYIKDDWIFYNKIESVPYSATLPFKWFRLYKHVRR